MDLLLQVGVLILLVICATSVAGIIPYHDNYTDFCFSISLCSGQIYIHFVSCVLLLSYIAFSYCIEYTIYACTYIYFLLFRC